jgi:hypothetical protein
MEQVGVADSRFVFGKWFTLLAGSVVVILESSAYRTGIHTELKIPHTSLLLLSVSVILNKSVCDMLMDKKTLLKPNCSVTNNVIQYTTGI